MNNHVEQLLASQGRTQIHEITLAHVLYFWFNRTFLHFVYQTKTLGKETT
jgi:hypothetical protein